MLKDQHTKCWSSFCVTIYLLIFSKKSIDFLFAGYDLIYFIIEDLYSV